MAWVWAYMVVLVDVQHFVQCRSDRHSCSSQRCHQDQIRTRVAQEENVLRTPRWKKILFTKMKLHRICLQ